MVGQISRQLIPQLMRCLGAELPIASPDERTRTGGLKKGQWSKSEDQLLSRGVQQYGQKYD